MIAAGRPVPHRRRATLALNGIRVSELHNDHGDPDDHLDLLSLIDCVLDRPSSPLLWASQFLEKSLWSTKKSVQQNFSVS